MANVPPFLSDDAPDLGRWFDVPTHALWVAAAERVLKGKPLHKLERDIADGVHLPVLHTSDTPVVGSSPDQAPWTRGSGGLQRREVGVDLRSIWDGGTVTGGAVAIADDAERRVRSFWIVPDGEGRGLPTPTEGATLRTVEDLRLLLAAVDIGAHPVDIEAGARASFWLGALARVGSDVGLLPAQITGSVVYDPVLLHATQGGLPGGVVGAYDNLEGHLDEAASALPSVHVFGVDAALWQMAGADPALELGLMAASLVQQLSELSARGVEPSTLVGRSRLRLAVGDDTFVELAKLRAARALWGRVMQAVGVEDGSVWVHGVTSGRSLTKNDPWVNMLRGTAGAFAAMVGGVDALTVMPYDHVLGVPDAQSRRIATNTALVLQEESHLLRVLDPAGGAWMIEDLTTQLCEAAWGIMQQVQAQGGMHAALRSGWIQERLQASAARTAKAVGSRRQGIIGVSLYPNPTESLPQRAPRDASSAEVSGWSAACAPVRVERLAEGWETLRAAVSSHGMSVALVTVGALPRHKGRLDFMARLMEAGGFRCEVVALDEAADLHAHRAAVLCGHDDDYARVLPGAIDALKAAGAPAVMVAGRAQEAWGPLDGSWSLGGPVFTQLNELAGVEVTR